MIFTQRLFTILLGLWFATVLTDRASALYDPGVGRFCSRDPVRYISGPSLYQNYFRQKLVDPSGLFAMTDDELSNPNPKLPPIELPPLIDVPWPLLPLVPVDPIAPIIPPGVELVNPLITCSDFLSKMYASEAKSDFLIEELKCNPHIFCREQCQRGDGPGNTAHPNNGERCYVCLNSSQVGDYHEWMALLLHELTHCRQFRAKGCACPDTPHKGPVPPLPKLGQTSYEDCVAMETEAYTRQCKYLFPNEPEKQDKCIRAGVCVSCQYSKNKEGNLPVGPCPPFPFYW
jgi:hypothetical protein